jgi:hypothetical protein
MSVGWIDGKMKAIRLPDERNLGWPPAAHPRPRLPGRGVVGVTATGTCWRTGWRSNGLLACKVPFRFDGRDGMIGARVRVVKEDGNLSIVVFAESLREVEHTAKTRYPESAIEIAFPIEPEVFFVSGPRSGVRAALEPTEGLTNPRRPS